MYDFNPLLNPLISDLGDKSGFKSFLDSTDFERICIKNLLITDWSNIKRELTPRFTHHPNGYIEKRDLCFETFKFLANFYFQKKSQKFDVLIVETINGYLDKSYFKQDFDKILSDLYYLGISDMGKMDILVAYTEHKTKHDIKEKERQEKSAIEQQRKKEESEKRLKLKEQKIKEESEKKKQLPIKSKANKLKVTSNTNNKSTFEVKKRNWLKSISRAEIEKVVDEIIEYGVENENDIIALSSRWHSLKSKYNNGVMKEDEFNIENNKIVHALLDFIKNLKDTEGV